MKARKNPPGLHARNHADRSTPNRVFLLLLLLALVVALAVRVPHLGDRPMHTDEAIHTVKFATLWQTGSYVYDPSEYHGPTLYYATLPIVWLAHARDFVHTSEWMYRLVPALFGAALILLVWPLSDGLGQSASLIAGLFIAISPGMTFYSRYYIQEILLVFFTLLLFAAIWRWIVSRRGAWLVTAGVALGLMVSTKETWVLSIAAAVGAVILTWALERPRVKTASQPPVRVGRRAVPTHIQPPALPSFILAFAAAVLVFILCYSAGFHDPKGPLDAFLAVAHYTHRAGGESTHVHAWSYYLLMLLDSRLFVLPPGRPLLAVFLKDLRLGSRAAGPGWSEALILGFAVAAMAAAFVGRGLGEAHRPLVRFLTFYTLLLTGIYSAIPYKTPWCALNFLAPIILLAGVGVVILYRALPGRIPRLLLTLVVIGGSLQLTWQDYRANFIFEASRLNPYVYSPTSPDLLNLVSRVHDVAHVSPQGSRTLLQVVVSHGDYWPLPWYLRDMPNVGYWETPPPTVAAPIVITSPDLGSILPNSRSYDTEYFGLRPAVVIALSIDQSLWSVYLKHGGARPAPNP